MAELRINSTLVELGDKRLVFSKSGYSFTDWLTKDITYSERVTLPETTVLNSIFGRPQAPEITSKKFSKLYTFTYSDFGKVIFSGIAKLEAFNENREYEILRNRYKNYVKECMRYFRRIEYGVRSGIIIMADLYHNNDQNYKNALLEYWAGRNSREFKYYSKDKNYIKNHYVVYSLGYIDEVNKTKWKSINNNI